MKISIYPNQVSNFHNIAGRVVGRWDGGNVNIHSNLLRFIHIATAGILFGNHNPFGRCSIAICMGEIGNMLEMDENKRANAKLVSHIIIMCNFIALVSFTLSN